MIETTYWELFTLITILWITVRGIIAIKNKNFSIRNELKMLLVYVCIVVIARIVNFPLHHVDGKIGTMKLDVNKIFPFRMNLIPIVHLFDIYDGWQINIIGNIAMFIPVGIVWPICFKELNTIGKTILSGAGFSLLIEITQLPFYERCSDVDDILLNTLGVVIGALICFGIKRLIRKSKSNAS